MYTHVPLRWPCLTVIRFYILIYLSSESPPCNTELMRCMVPLWCTPSGVRYKRSIDELSLIILPLLTPNDEVSTNLVYTIIYKVNFLLARVGPRIRLWMRVYVFLTRKDYDAVKQQAAKCSTDGATALVWCYIARIGRPTGSHVADRRPGSSPDGRWKN